MDSKTFQIPAILDGFTFHKDGGAGLRFVTRELSTEDIVCIKAFYGGEGWLLFRENTFEAKDVPKENDEIGGKTPSQRLRNVLFVLWTEKGSSGDFETWYRSRMESLIEQLKGKIEGKE